MGKLIFIGLGLYNGRDISLRGVDELKNSEKIYAEFYTATMAKGTIEYLESKINKKIEVLTREQVEDGKEILAAAQTQQVAFLTHGDSLTATTHVELLLSAKKSGIDTVVIHGSSIATAVPGLLGLQFYKFGRTTTIAYPDGNYFPESPYDVIAQNLTQGLHTLVLLDIHANEKRYMTANEGIEILLNINSKRKDNVFTAGVLTCVIARAGAPDMQIIANSAEKLLNMDFGEPMHTLVIPGHLHFKEAEALKILANAPKELVTHEK